MLKKLRRTFILIAMLAMLMTISIFYLAITYSNYKRTIEKADTLTEIICDNGGQIPEYSNAHYTDREKQYITPESRFSTRYIVVYFDKEGNIEKKDLTHIASISDKEAEETAKKLINRKSETGLCKDLRYRIRDTENGKMLVMLDFKGELLYLRNSTSRGALIIIVGFAIIFVIITILSNRALRPMEMNLENQKQFVTNAGHDLKTPIAIILANTEVLEATLGDDNEWLNSIKRQAIKMDNLTKGLLNMSKLEDGKIEPEMADFSITELIETELKDLKTLAKEKKLTINFERVEANVKADRNLIRQVIVVLIDNAIKYTDENGKIDIKIIQNKKQVRVEIINDYKDYKNFNEDKVFDRFYRGDKSRNSEKNMGYGIGLSMAKSIMEAHNGKIKADVTKENRVRFAITLNKE